MGVIARPFSLRGRMMAKAWNQTRVSEALGIEYPIIQGPLGGLSSQRLTAAVSNFGGLGSFGAHGLEPNAIEDVIAEIRSLTAKPFAMNLWVSMEDGRVARLNSSYQKNLRGCPAPSFLLGRGFSP